MAVGSNTSSTIKYYRLLPASSLVSQIPSQSLIRYINDMLGYFNTRHQSITKMIRLAALLYSSVLS